MKGNKGFTNLYEENLCPRWSSLDTVQILTLYYKILRYVKSSCEPGLSR